MNDQDAPYLSYLLRLWVVKNHQGVMWRCSVENVRTGKRQGFENPEAFCNFLQETTNRLLDAAVEHENCDE